MGFKEKMLARLESRPLNRLTSQEYFEDFMLYVENCDVPEQCNPYTYIEELEHQEGSVPDTTKLRFYKMVKDDMMVKADNLYQEFREGLEGEVAEALRDRRSYKETIGHILTECNNVFDRNPGDGYFGIIMEGSLCDDVDHTVMGEVRVTNANPPIDQTISVEYLESMSEDGEDIFVMSDDGKIILVIGCCAYEDWLEDHKNYWGEQ